MLKSVVNSLRKKIAASEDQGGEDREQALKLATASLLVEMSRADNLESTEEQALIVNLLQEHFGLTEEQVTALFSDASDKASEVVSLYEFTSLLHESLDDVERETLLEMLWRVAYADRELDPEEDALVRKVADLLYVRNTQLLKVRNRVLSEVGED